MKAPTRAAWKASLLAYEKVMNVLLQQPDITYDDRIALNKVHRMLRLRASGVSDE